MGLFRAPDGSRLASLLSVGFHPIFVSAGLFWVFVEAERGPGVPRLALLLSLLFGAVLPLAFLLVLRSQGRVSGLGLPHRGERTLPLLLTMVSYAVGIWALCAASAGPKVIALMGSQTAAAGLAAIVTRQWKISLHSLGAGCALGALYYSMGIRAGWLLPAVGAVGWARIRAGAHSPLQVLAGAGLGALITFGAMELLA